MKKIFLITLSVILIFPNLAFAQVLGPDGQIGPFIDGETVGGEAETTGPLAAPNPILEAAESETTSATPTETRPAGVVNNNEEGIADGIKGILSGLVNINKPVNQTTRDANIKRYWSFFRSFINYILVAMLILAAISTVTPFGALDNYTIKKTLPNLLLGFILANFSLFICQTILDFSESIVTTLESVGGAAGAIDAMFSNFSGVVTLVIAGVITGIATGGWGLIIAPVVVFLILLLPLVVQLSFLLLFVARHLIVQYLVIFSPIAFMALGTTFTQGFFKTWWKQFSLWVFLKPMAWGLLVLGGLFVNSNLGGSLVAFAAGIGTMIAAIIIPFTQAGKVGSIISNGLKSAGNSLRYGAGAAGAKLAAGGGRFAGLGEVMQAAAFAPEKYKQLKEEKRGRIAAAGQAAAGARIFKRPQDLENFEDSQISKYEGEIGDNENEDLLLNRLRQASDIYQVAGIVRKSYKNRVNHKFFDKVMKDPVLAKKFGLSGLENDARGRAVARARMMGGKVNAVGEVTGSMAKRQGVVLQNIAKQNGFKHEYAALDGAGNIKTQAKIDADVSGYFTGSPMDQAKMNRDDWVQFDSAGKVTGIKPGALKAIKEGALNGFIDNERALGNLDSDVGGLLANMGSTPAVAEAALRRQLSAQGLSGPRIDALVTQIMKYRQN